MKKLKPLLTFLRNNETLFEVVFGIIGGTAFVFMTFATKTEVKAGENKRLGTEIIFNAKLDALDCKMEDLLERRKPRRDCRPVYPTQFPEEEK